VVDVPNVVKYCRKLSGTILSRQVEYACTDEAAEEIKDLASRHNLTHIVLAACSCCNLGQICFSCSDRRVQCKANLVDSNQQDNICYEFVNIREHCAWVHYRQPEAATDKAKSLIRAGLARVRESQPLTRKKQNVEQSVLVVGDGLSGMQAATDLAVRGLPTILISHNGQGVLSSPENHSLSEQFRATRNQLEEKVARSGAAILGEAKLINVDGTAGNYLVSVSDNGKSRRFTVGAIIIDISSRSDGQTVNPVAAEVELPAFLIQAFSTDNVCQKIEQSDFEPAVSRLMGIFLCGTGQGALDVAEALVQGSAAASKASVLLNKGTIDIEQTAVTVDIKRCRGCANCESACPFDAIMVTEGTPGVHNAEVNDALCRGCGVCLAHCPTGALSQNGYNDRQLIASLEAILS
jgi:heterodisulfide reductase subunit A-like polyferredoxin